MAAQVKHDRSNKVGNKAVQEMQEIAAAKPVYKAGHALVVTSGPGYTRSAEQLAHDGGVALWSLDELAQLRRGGRPRGLPSA